MNMIPEINNNAILYAYKEPWFTGFAPCFDGGMYSLACCKGDMRRKSIRKKICDEGKKPQDIWILSIAGKAISDKDNNSIIKGYQGGDIIYLARVKELLSWKEYGDEYGKRKDAIYKYDENTHEMIWQNNNYHDNSYINSDCGNRLADYPNIPQIVLAEEYYIFNPGNKISELQDPKLQQLQNMGPGYRYKGIVLNKVIDFMRNNSDKYEYKPKIDIVANESIRSC